MTALTETDVFRCEPPRIRINESIIAVLSCVMLGGIPAFAVGPPWRFVILAVTGVVAVWSVRRALRLSLVASTETVVVRNYWRAYKFHWLDVTDVGLGMEPMGVLPQPAVAFGLRDGRTIRAQATPFRSSDQQLVFDALAALAPPSVEFFVPVSGREPGRASG